MAGLGTRVAIGALFALVLFGYYTHYPIERVRKVPAVPNFVEHISIREIVKGSLSQDDPRIIKFIQDNFLIPPSGKKYNLKNPNEDPSKGQSEVIKTIFNHTRNLFFVEAGGFDGETRSNTLSLEKDYGWKGILVEGSKKNFDILKTKNRNAWIINACLAIKPFAHQVLFEEKANIGKISNSAIGKGKTENLSPTQCFPIYSILAAMGVTKVDYFSLDVEGHELDVLRTIPFGSISIKVLSVEFVHDKGKAESIVNFMKLKNYTEITRVLNKFGYANDVILVHNSIRPKVNPFPPLINTQ